MDGIVSTILFIVALGLLICLHELGHFSFAKLFNVYCHEFSIGFGPALIHKRKKGKETFFSLRIIPVGGYISMYGEEGEEFEEGVKLPPERSIEGIKKWKKAIIVSGGIVVNALLAIIFFLVSNFCFPISSPTNCVRVEENSVLVDRVNDNDAIEFTLQDENYYFSWQYTNVDGILSAGIYAIVDDDVLINEDHYVLVYSPKGTKSDNSFSDCVSLYKGVSSEYINNTPSLKAIYGNWMEKENAPAYFPDIREETLKPESSFEIDLTILREQESIPVHVTMSYENDKFSDLGLTMLTIDSWLPMSERWSNTWDDFGTASSAVFKGIGMLFKKNGIKNMSGIVGIFNYSTELYSTYTFATYLYFWGLISINLAIFNFLPFPGLDGWQLLITLIEGISKKKIPSKFKSIMSIIGMVLLIGLMVLIVVLDIKRLI